MLLLEVLITGCPATQERKKKKKKKNCRNNVKLFQQHACLVFSSTIQSANEINQRQWTVAAHTRVFSSMGQGTNDISTTMEGASKHERCIDNHEKLLRWGGSAASPRLSEIFSPKYGTPPIAVRVSNNLIQV